MHNRQSQPKLRHRTLAAIYQQASRPLRFMLLLEFLNGHGTIGIIQRALHKHMGYRPLSSLLVLSTNLEPLDHRQL